MRRSALNQVRYHNISTLVCSSTELILLLGRHFCFSDEEVEQSDGRVEPPSRHSRLLPEDEMEEDSESAVAQLSEVNGGLQFSDASLLCVQEA